MREDLLHFIWKFRLLRPVSLCTTAHSPLEIVHPGLHNTHAGPDFTNGRIRFSGAEWVGNIEIHRRSSEWNLHGHQHDAAYDNVILHVVFEHDQAAFTSKNVQVPVLELQHYIEEGVLEKYESLYRNKQEIPCGSAFSDCEALHREPWLERMLVERLEGKTALIKEIYQSTRHNWEETFYLLLCRNFGFKVNSEPFLQLGRITPVNLLLRHSNDLLKVESLLFGQAGLLEAEFKEPYSLALQREYRFLQHKYGLRPMLPQSWKFMRMRPVNFPTVRIAQMAAFIQQYRHTFSRLTELTNIDEVKNLFSVQASAFWTDHYTFTHASPPQEKKLGMASIENLLINTVCPILFFYGRERQHDTLCERAIDWFASLQAENNHVTRQYEKLGFACAHAGHSQALLQLHAHYCTGKRCLQCAIGAQALKPNPPIEV